MEGLAKKMRDAGNKVVLEPFEGSDPLLDSTKMMVINITNALVNTVVEIRKILQSSGLHTAATASPGAQVKRPSGPSASSTPGQVTPSSSIASSSSTSPPSIPPPTQPGASVSSGGIRLRPIPAVANASTTTGTMNAYDHLIFVTQPSKQPPTWDSIEVERNLQPIVSDQELFVRLGQRYKFRRSFMERWTSVKSLQRITFVQVYLRPTLSCRPRKDTN